MTVTTNKFFELKAAGDALDALFNKLIDKLMKEDIAPCRRRRDKKDAASCIHKAEDERDREGRPLLWFGIDCADRARKLLCPTCLAYWLVAVARNLMLEDFLMRKEIAVAQERRAAHGG